MVGLLFACGEPQTSASPIAAHATKQTAIREVETPSTKPAALTATVHHARELSRAEIENAQHLDLALSAIDRVGIGTDDSDPCAGLDLAALGRRMPDLKSLRISGCQEQLASGLGALSANLVELELADVELDSMLIEALVGFSRLRSLELTRVTAGTVPVAPLGRLRLSRVVLRELEKDSVIASLLGDFPETLTRVELEGAWAGHEAMLSLSKAKGLETLAIRHTRIGNFSLNQIKPLTQLRELVLEGPTFNDNSPLYMRELPVDRFVCACPRLGNAGIRNLRHTRTLRRLELPDSQVTDHGFGPLADLHGLEELVLAGRDLGPDGFASLAMLPRLRRLVIHDAELTIADVPALGALQALEELVLGYRNAGDEIMPHVGRLTNLRRLDLGGTRISDAGMVHLAKLTGLVELRLHHTRVTNRGLVHLAKLGALEVLELDHTDVVDEGVAHLQGLKNLRDLRLDSTLITDRAIETLVQLPNLERLNLGHTVVTGEGAAKLAGLASLKAVNLEGTRAERP